MPKTRKGLLWGLVTLVGVVLLARGVNFVWYQIALPSDFRSANWKGTWESSRGGALAGKLLVNLPDPIPENEDFEAEALVYYPVYSPYKTGQFVRITFTGHLKPGEKSTAGVSTSTIPGGGMLKFKGIAGNQVIDYQAFIDGRHKSVVGSYSSTGPSDIGSFVIEKAD